MLWNLKRFFRGQVYKMVPSVCVYALSGFWKLSCTQLHSYWYRGAYYVTPKLAIFDPSPPHVTLSVKIWLTLIREKRHGNTWLDPPSLPSALHNLWVAPELRCAPLTYNGTYFFEKGHPPTLFITAIFHTYFRGSQGNRRSHLLVHSIHINHGSQCSSVLTHTLVLVYEVVLLLWGAMVIITVLVGCELTCGVQNQLVGATCTMVVFIFFLPE